MIAPASRVADSKFEENKAFGLDVHPTDTPLQKLVKLVAERDNRVPKLHEPEEILLGPNHEAILSKLDKEAELGEFYQEAKPYSTKPSFDLKERVINELGDVLWAIFAWANKLGINIEDSIKAVFDKNKTRLNNTVIAANEERVSLSKDLAPSIYEPLRKAGKNGIF